MSIVKGQMSDCIFCKIVNQELPAFKVYEDEEFLAFLDIMPVNPGHTLVIPKTHYKNMEEIPEDVLGRLMGIVKKIGLSIKDNLGAESYNINENNDPAAGQIIPHIHFHVIPRNEGDGLKLWPQEKYAEGEAEKVLEKIKF